MKHAHGNWSRRERTWGSSIAFGLLGFLLLATSPLGAQEAGAPGASPSSVQAAELEYREVNYSLLSRSLPLVTQTKSFAKEPKVGSRDVIRGSLKFGNESGQFVPFLWDQGSGKLYLDLNRNRDLTDDPAGVFTCPAPHRSFGYYQTFTNIHLAFKTATGNHPALVDLSLYDYSHRPGGSVQCRSFREGKLALQGREWQVGLVENICGKLDSTGEGYLLMRPWASRQQPFNLQDGSLDGFAFPRRLFLNQQGYQVDYACAGQGETAKGKLIFREQPAELGELKLSGQFIHRLVLPCQPGKTAFTVVLDTPGPEVKIPVGAYGPPEVHLKQGKTEAHRELEPSVFRSVSAASVVVKAGKPGLLAVGGPLTNTVSANRRGGSLYLSYKLVGAGGSYQLNGLRRQPEFAIYQGDKKLASGKFDFG